MNVFKYTFTIILLIGFVVTFLSGCAAEVGKNKNDDVTALSSENAALKERNIKLKDDLKQCDDFARRTMRGTQ